VQWSRPLEGRWFPGVRASQVRTATEQGANIHATFTLSSRPAPAAHGSRADCFPTEWRENDRDDVVPKPTLERDAKIGADGGRGAGWWFLEPMTEDTVK